MQIMELSKRSNRMEGQGCSMSLTCTTSEESQTSIPQLSAIVECQAKNRRMTLQDKLPSCEKHSQMQKSSRISGVDLTSKEKDCKPFYNDLCKDISSHLLSHTEIDLQDSEYSSLSSCCNRMVENSWFSTNLKYHPNGNLQKTCLQFFMSSHAGCTVSEGMKVKSRKIRIYPTTEQKILFNKWFGVSRKFYNESVSWYNSETKDTIQWMEVAKRFIHSFTEDYVKEVPYQIKKIAVQDCYRTFVFNCKKTKKTKHKFVLKFRTRKNPYQSCYIPKSALSEFGIYHTISGKMHFTETSWLNHGVHDARLLKEYDRWYVVVPLVMDNKILPCSENQGSGDVVAIDQGIRSFITYFSENGNYGQIGHGSFKRLLSLQLKLDKLQSKYSVEKDKKHKCNLRRSMSRCRFHISSLVDELHWKTINYLVRNYSVILLPTFETSGMVMKGNMKLRKSVVRSMQCYRFYEFGERLSYKCKEYGVLLLRCNESYTSKTNSFNGELFDIGSREWFIHDGIKVNRDINGARNIMLRAMRDSSADGCNAVG